MAHRVLIADPAGLADNASGIAAGMLAPAFEAALDPASSGRFDLFLRARDAWAPFAMQFDLAASIHRCGAVWLGEPGAAEQRAQSLSAMGARARCLPPGEVAALCPALNRDRTFGAVLTSDDWRLDPVAVLAGLHRALRRGGGRRVQASIVAFANGKAAFDDGATWAADLVVYAGGYPTPVIAALAPELAHLSPIKGQILRFEAGAGPVQGPIIRSGDIYVVPGADGARVGATMEPGRSDRRIDPVATARMQADAAGLFTELAGARAEPLAGVRAATADGLPLAGASAAPGVVLATGARRNGWLLAPLIAAQVAAAIAGGTGGVAEFDPQRFG